ncbi:MAG: hypothetical protein V4565_01800 [Bacteroidota bacterium]
MTNSWEHIKTLPSQYPALNLQSLYGNEIYICYGDTIFVYVKKFTTVPKIFNSSSQGWA